MFKRFAYLIYDHYNYNFESNDLLLFRVLCYNNDVKYYHPKNQIIKIHHDYNTKDVYHLQ